MPYSTSNELKLSALLKSSNGRFDPSKILGMAVTIAGSFGTLIAVAYSSGYIIVYNDLWHEPLVHIATDYDMIDLCFASTDRSGLLPNLLVAHSGGVLRIWDLQDSMLRGEIENGVEIISLHSTSKSVFFRSIDNEIRRWDQNTATWAECLVGFSKSATIRHIYSDSAQSLVGIVDGFGQLFIYDVSVSLTPLVSEKMYNEAFSVCLTRDTVVLVCPLKIILFRLVTEEGKPRLDPIKSVLGTNWRHSVILSPERILAFTETGIIELRSEDTLKIRGSTGHMSKIVALGPKRMLAYSDGSMHELILVDDVIAWKHPSGSFTDNLETIASDGSHLFLVEGLKVFPVGIDCCIDLQVPTSTGRLTALSGLALDQRILGGFSCGKIVCWMTGSSGAEFVLQDVSTSPIIRIDRVVSGSHLWVSLDSTGTLCVLDMDRKISRLQPCMLIPLLIKGYDYEIFLDVLGDSVTCRTQRGKILGFEETWSITKQHVISKPQQRTENVTISKKEVELLQGIWVSKDRNIISISCCSKVFNEAESLFQSYRGPVGTSVASSVTGTTQGFFSRSPGRTAMMLMRFFSTPTVFSDNDVFDKIGWSGGLEILLNLLDRYEEDSYMQVRIVFQIKRQIFRMHCSRDVSFLKFVHKYPAVALIVLALCPHCFPGYRQAVLEVSSNESPYSKETIWLTELVEEILTRINVGKVKRYEVSLLTDAFPHVRSFIANKALFHDAFCTLFSQAQSSPTVTHLLLAIGQRNMATFSKRLALMVKTTHSSDTPLYLLREMVNKYRVHSIRSLPCLFETVVLPCLNPMDYRVRKTSVEPVTDLFKTLTKLYPMTCFHQNTQKFALGSTQGQVIVYDVRSGTKWRVLEGHTGAISAVGFDGSGKYLCSYSATDKTVRVWHITSGGGVLVNTGASSTSILSGLLGSGGGKCITVKQLGEISDGDRIQHPFDLNYRINGVKIRWTSETDILVVRETGEGVQIRL